MYDNGKVKCINILNAILSTLSINNILHTLSKALCQYQQFTVPILKRRKNQFAKDLAVKQMFIYNQCKINTTLIQIAGYTLTGLHKGGTAITRVIALVKGCKCYAVLEALS